MFRFIRYIIVFFVVVFLLDRGFGLMCSYLNSHAKGGDTLNHYYIANEMTDSVLIFGSSRAIHHFNPKILEDSLGMTAYNCGLDGNGILYNYGRLLTILNRYTPRMIIYDVIPSFDMEKDDYTKYLQWQKRWYDVDGIAEIFHDVNPMEDVKMQSNLYRYNTSFIQMASDNIRPLQDISYKGYKPLEGRMNYESKEMESNPALWDDLKLSYFRKFIELCKENDIELVISYSPWYNAKDSRIYDGFSKLIDEYDLELIDLFSDSELVHNKDYFADASHLNSEGADAFTSKFVSVLKADNEPKP